MWRSIPEKLKTINSGITAWIILSLVLTVCVLTILSLYLWAKMIALRQEISISPAEKGTYAVNAQPFGAVNSPVYTYAWCTGADKIKETNKIVFRDAEEAERLGRALSKLCDR